MRYDPSTPPDPAEWLALTEQERLDQVLDYHDRAKATLPNARLHAALHVTVENQLAEQYQPAVDALERLVAEGLERHDAVHAIAGVAAAQLHQLIQRRAPTFDEAVYKRELAVLTAESWKKGAG